MTHEGLQPDPANHNHPEEFKVVDKSEQELQHNCGIVGFYYNEPASIDEMMISLSLLQHRGEEGSGLLVIPATGAAEMWETNELLVNLSKDGEYDRFYRRTKDVVRIGVGHNRYSTSGVTNDVADATPGDSLHIPAQSQDESVSARQPFYSHNLVTAHNGTLTNPRLLPGYKDGAPSDTKVLHDTISEQDGKNLDDKIRSTLPGVEGAFSLILADPQSQALYGIRDPWGIRPLFLGKLKGEKGYMLASEPVAMANLVEEEDIQEVEPGHGIKIQDGKVEEFYKDPRDGEVKRAACIFESLYFARPNSTLFGMNSGKFRAELGAALAQEDYDAGTDFDVILPVPRSGLKAGEGYVNKRNTLKPTPFTFGLERNDSSEAFQGRTFTSTRDRKDKVRRKFNVNKDSVEGKRVMTIDDTLVRGTTSEVLIEMLREAGATEVHFGLPAPPVMHPCYWGIDFPSKDELTAADKTEDEIAKAIGADSVSFLSVDTMLDVAEGICGHRDFCTHCFSGKAPMVVNTEYMILKEDIKKRKTAPK